MIPCHETRSPELAEIKPRWRCGCARYWVSTEPVKIRDATEEHYTLFGLNRRLELKVSGCEPPPKPPLADRNPDPPSVTEMMEQVYGKGPESPVRYSTNAVERIRFAEEAAAGENVRQLKRKKEKAATP